MFRLGALDGTTYSNTYALEQCYNWTGLLLEANPTNAAKLLRNKARRRATKVHSAVCDDGVGWYNVTVAAGGRSGNPEFLNDEVGIRQAALTTTVAVPCKPLYKLMAEANLAGGATFLSLDVEGAEPYVLGLLGNATFDYVLVETSGPPTHYARIDQFMRARGMHEVTGIKLRGSAVYERWPPALSEAKAPNAGDRSGRPGPIHPELRLIECVLRQATSVAERVLLPTLLRVSGGGPGRFLELGHSSIASVTAALERCYHWTGATVVSSAAGSDAFRASGRSAMVIIAEGGLCAAVQGGSAIVTRQPGEAQQQQPYEQGIVLRRPLSTRPSPVAASQVAVAARMPCMTLPEVMRNAAMPDGAHFLAASFPMAIERVFDAPTLHMSSSQTPKPRRSPRDHSSMPNGRTKRNGTWAWKPPEASARFDVIAARWHGPGAWERCAMCRIAISASPSPLLHERKMALYAPILEHRLHKTHVTSGQVELRAFTPRSTCSAVYMGRGIKTCFEPSFGGACDHLKSEGACIWAERQQWYDNYHDRRRFDA